MAEIFVQIQPAPCYFSILTQANHPFEKVILFADFGRREYNDVGLQQVELERIFGCVDSFWI